MKKYTIDYIKGYNIKAAFAHSAAFIAFACIAYVVLKPTYKSTSVYRIGATAPEPGQIYYCTDVASNVGGYLTMTPTYSCQVQTTYGTNSNGLLAQFLTPTNIPNATKIPGGTWKCSAYFSTTSVSPNLYVYISLLKYDGSTFTLVNSSSQIPITTGATVTKYDVDLLVDEVSLASTDRLVIRVDVGNLSSGGILIYLDGTTPFQVTSTYIGNSGVNDILNSLDFPTRIFRLGSINIANWILIFFGLTVVFHILYGTDFFGKGYYTKWLLQGWNPIRWFEYAISASLMIIIISMLVGVKDITSIWAYFFIVAALQFCGLIVERESIKFIKDIFQVQVATGIGWTLLLAVWIPILYSIVKIIGDARGYAANVPAWVPIIVVIQFFQYSWFGFIQLKQVRAMVKQIPLPDFLSIERSYIMLSFASKLALGGFIGYGLVQRQNQKIELK